MQIKHVLILATGVALLFYWVGYIAGKGPDYLGSSIIKPDPVTINNDNHL